MIRSPTPMLGDAQWSLKIKQRKNDNSWRGGRGEKMELKGSEEERGGVFDF